MAGIQVINRERLTVCVVVHVILNVGEEYLARMQLSLVSTVRAIFMTPHDEVFAISKGLSKSLR